MEDGDDLEEEFLVDGAAEGVFVLFWKAVTELEVEAFPCFWEWNSRASFSAYLTWWHLQSCFQ